MDSHALFRALLRVMALGIAISGPAGVAVVRAAQPDFQVHGFLSQGYVLTSENNFFGNSTSNGSFEFTELGVNAFWRLTPSVHAAVQLLSRRAGESSNGEIRLDYGMVDYRAVSNESLDFGVRVGRIKNPLGFYNDTRDVAFTRPGVILPQSIYFDRTRDLALSSDAVQFYANRRNAKGEWELQLGIGNPDVDDLDTELSLLGADRAGDLREELSYLGRLMYERDGGNIRVGLTGAQLNMDYAPGVGDPSGPGSIRFTPVILSAQYNAENWSLTGEYAQRQLEFDDSIIYVPSSLKHFTGESYYLQGSYRLDPQWEALVRYDVTYLNKDDRNGEDMATLTGGARPDYSQFAKDWTIGLRWDPHRSWMVRAEHHWVDGTAWLPLQDNPVPSETERRWRLFTLLVSFRF
ncbi:MAG: hypothetical protein J5I92_06830 [Thiogranum sp.]|nr:hypothetical protein [Thiogranum sp.]